jgi:uncharacterized protein with NAD-binding domain and iron-sulfur cluster
MLRAGTNVDRVLNGPTSDVWIDPWVDTLRDLGVQFHYDSRVTHIGCDGDRVTGIAVRTADGVRTTKADWYLGAVPVEILHGALVNDDLVAAEPRLGQLGNLVTRWMNGIMYYLPEDIPLERGHAIFIDSDWALTCISQRQFWPAMRFEALGDGRTRGILSVDVSDWTTASRELGVPAIECSRDMLVREVWRQMRAHLPLPDLDGGGITAFVDPDIEWPNPTGVEMNLEPLLVNTAGSWASRPDAVTRIRDFFLAGDYVRTNTDLATMEAANEAARRAVNGILDASGTREERCEVWKLQEPAWAAPARAVDKLRFATNRR